MDPSERKGEHQENHDLNQEMQDEWHSASTDPVSEPDADEQYEIERILDHRMQDEDGTKDLHKVLMERKGYSVQHNSPSSYGSIPLTGRITVEVAMEYRDVVRVMGDEMDGPCQTYEDKSFVIFNTRLPPSKLKMKHNSINYHAIREAIAGNIVKLNPILSELNGTDMLTKPLPPEGFHPLVRLLCARSGTPGEG